MLNPNDFNAELNARVYEILLRIKFANVLTQEDMKTLCYATGVSINFDGQETRLQRLQRMAREAEEWKKQHDQEAAQAALRG